MSIGSIDDEDTSVSFWDREAWATSFLEAGSYLQRPLYWVSKEVHQIPTPLGTSAKVQEVFRRIYDGILASFTWFGFGVTALVGSGIYRLGTMLRRDNFTHWKGKAPEINVSDLPQKTYKVMGFNVRGWPGATSLWKGVPGWQERIEGLKKQLEEENVQVLSLFEVKDPALIRALYEGLQGSFAHFFVHFGKGSDLLIASKFPAEVSFEHFRGVKEGFTHIDLSSNGKVFSRITATHPPSDKKHLEQMMQSIAQKHFQNPAREKEISKFLCISGIENYQELLNQRFFDPDLEQTEETSRDFPPFLGEQKGEPEGKISDAILPIRRLRGIEIPGSSILRTIKLSPGYEKTVNTSDHHGVVAHIQV